MRASHQLPVWEYRPTIFYLGFSTIWSFMMLQLFTTLLLRMDARVCIFILYSKSIHYISIYTQTRGLIKHLSHYLKSNRSQLHGAMATKPTIQHCYKPHQLDKKGLKSDNTFSFLWFSWSDEILNHLASIRTPLINRIFIGIV
jgi:hypothetical protein